MAIYGTLGDIDVGNTDYPSIQPTLDLNFAKTKALDPRITFYRGSFGTYVDDKGIICTVPENVPRFDHDPTTGESLGLLIEESRTNLHLYSEDLSNWVAETGASVTSNAHISPDGTQTADALNGTLDGSSAYRITTLSNATTYTFSVFLKYISGVTNIEIQIGDAPFSSGRSYTTFNVQTGTLVSNSGGTAVVNAVQNYGNGWYRYSITRTTTTSGGAFMDINHRTTTPSTIAVWGAQVEQGSFPTSYIPTSATSVTRSADICYIDGTNFSSWYNPIESTFYTNYVMNSLDGAYNNPSFYAYSDNQNHLAIFGYSPAYAWAQASNTTAAGISLGGTTTTNVDYKVSFGVKLNDFAASINGSTVSTDTSGNVPVVNQMFIGKRVEVSNAHLNGTLKRLTYYPKRLTNTQLQNLTA